MKLSIQAKPNSREEKIEQTGSHRFVVSVKEPPIQGRANVAICRVLAEYFGVAIARVRIVSGYTSRQKVIEIT